MNDLMCLLAGLVGIALVLIQFTVNDFDIEGTMYEEDER